MYNPETTSLYSSHRYVEYLISEGKELLTNCWTLVTGNVFVFFCFSFDKVRVTGKAGREGERGGGRHEGMAQNLTRAPALSTHSNQWATGATGGTGKVKQHLFFINCTCKRSWDEVNLKRTISMNTRPSSLQANLTKNLMITACVKPTSFVR